MKALVLGANGYLGSHLVHNLLRHGFEVIPTSRSKESIHAFSNYVQCDLTNMQDVRTLDLDVDLVFAFAGMTGTANGFDSYDKFIDNNVLTLLNLLDHHRRSQSKSRIIFPSTRLVYKGQSRTKLTEDAEKLPLSIYAQNKLSCENYLQMYNQVYGINYTIFRISVPFGNQLPGKLSYGTLGFFLGKAQKNEDIEIFGDGDQKRTFTHVHDIAQAIILAIENDSSTNQTYNIGGNDELSVREVAEMIASRFNIKVISRPWPELSKKIESGDTVFDSKRLEFLINKYCKYNLDRWISSLNITKSN